MGKGKMLLVIMPCDISDPSISLYLLVMQSSAIKFQVIRRAVLNRLMSMLAALKPVLHTNISQFQQ